MKFHLRVFDNNHHWDESSAYNHGSYETYEEAVAAAKGIVREFFVGECKSGSKAGQLLAMFGMYGEEPVVFPNEPASGEKFSPRDYAKEYVNELCKRFK